MQAPSENTSVEIKRLERCISDLVSLLALPAVWSGSDTSQILQTLLEALMRMLRLDLVSVRLTDPLTGGPVEIVRITGLQQPIPPAHEICDALEHCVRDGSRKWPPLLRKVFGDGDVSIVPLPLGPQGEIGMIIAAVQRNDFPQQTEALLLSVAANQASIGLQEARLRNRQKQIAEELDHRVAVRTMELGQANDELRKEIAERKQAEEKLRRSEVFLAEGHQLARIGSFSWRVATGEITWSEQLYRTFGFEPGTPVTLELIATRVHPEDRPLMSDMIEQAGRGVSNFEYEHRLQMPDLSVKHLHLIAQGTCDKDGHFEYIGAVQDVTQRRFSEEALSRARSELAHVARITSLGVLTASIAHEVNQPLSGIITNASTCLRMLATDPPNIDGAQETARRTIRDGNRASEVISRLRALFSKKDVTMEPMDLNEATREVIALSLRGLQRNRITVQTDLADDLPPVMGDRVQLEQVILNLVRNASDAMSAVDDRQRQLLIRTEQDDGDYVRLTVQDAGVGFDPHAVDKLFEAFHTTKTDGMGIGLSVSRSIVESHRGRLSAKLNDGPGATFSFSIPCAPDGEAQTRRVQEVPKRSEPDMDAA
jgi:signal transduction histidine kinase